MSEPLHLKPARNTQHAFHPAPSNEQQGKLTSRESDMNRDTVQKLTDIMMGEAVLSLLHDGSAVSASVLITRLHMLAANEQSEARRQACEWAIAEIRNSHNAASNSDTQQVHNAENVHYLFNHDDTPEDEKH
jgi:hypothetical protein